MNGVYNHLLARPRDLQAAVAHSCRN